ncbi:gag polyprotein, inner coat protein p12 domain-containing protein [Purpureocillium lilacinum]|uniref:Gag polyprotein, inner coat protein p12 domain-containing protein n=1 Tax=Purpureocillium lilacinum TaxID=33203 RepID=A0A179GUI4_PURLI|nr:gag polyprotein, inner coat protein p12 domain-containing protein [Purpureocillium lilacinum]OAQ80921.1 gag polyprotein, inner coat protein p12 domain-containing protein [Purpureocillium lilacinum]
MMMMMVVVVAHDAHQPVGLALSGTDGCCTSRCRPVRSALLCRDISSSPCPPKVQVISVPGRHPACSLTTCFPPPIRAPPKPATARHADSGRNRTASTSQAPLVCRASQTRALTTIDITQGPGDGPAVCNGAPPSRPLLRSAQTNSIPEALRDTCQDDCSRGARKGKSADVGPWTIAAVRAEVGCRPGHGETASRMRSEHHRCGLGDEHVVACSIGGMSPASFDQWGPAHTL